MVCVGLWCFNDLICFVGFKLFLMVFGGLVVCWFLMVPEVFVGFRWFLSLIVCDVLDGFWCF